MTSDDVAAHLSAIMYSVEHGMTPKLMIEKMSTTQQYSSVDRQVVYKWHRRFSTDWEESGAKRRSTDGTKLKVSPDRTLRYQGRPAMFI